jgi:hypothetical protein
MSHHADAAARPPPLIALVTSVPVRPSPMQPASSRGPPPKRPAWSGCGRMTVRRVEGGAREKGLDACTTMHQGEHILLGSYTGRA